MLPMVGFSFSSSLRVGVQYLVLAIRLGVKGHGSLGSLARGGGVVSGTLKIAMKATNTVAVTWKETDKSKVSMLHEGSLVRRPQRWHRVK
jgi:hypothetical protein